MFMRKGYSPSPFGQIHWRMMGEGLQPELYCLHPAPFSGLAFTGIIPHLAQNRRIVAADYPGHGGSDPLDDAPTILAYAAAVLSVINEQSGGGPVDLLGFHTGCLVAAELALIAPDQIRQIVMIDVPFLNEQERKDMLVEAAMPPVLTLSLDCLASAWERGMTRRVESQGIDRSFAMFVEQLRHGDHMNDGFAAARDYDSMNRFAAVPHPVTVIATQSQMLDPSRSAARTLPNSCLIERIDVKRAALDEAADIIAAEILTNLDKLQQFA
jgi:pimeloyl-ACP methyl ester carboxylesterase